MHILHTSEEIWNMYVMQNILKITSQVTFIQAVPLQKLNQRQDGKPDMKHACGIQEFNLKFWL
jgi:hypothetical protein